MRVHHDIIKAEVLDRWEHGGPPRGASTGWPSVDEFYTVNMGQWTLVTGTPGSGKSEWIDALMVNLAKREEWRFAIYSPENWPLAQHHEKILEKYIGKPFSKGPTRRMDRDEVEAGEEWMRKIFSFCKPDRPDIMTILDEAADYTYTAGTQWKGGIVVDPWNYLEHHIRPGQTETQYISEVLSAVIDVVRKLNLHLWLVAHPKIMQKDKNGTYPIPRPYDISGGAHWWNKSDNCITVWRDQAQGNQDVDIHIQKVRFKHTGKIGLASLKYDRVTGRYHEPLQAVQDERYA